MSRLNLRYWRAETGDPVDREITGTPEIRTAVAEAAAEYRAAGIDFYPGVIVAADVEEPSNSVTLVPVPDGMALIHTDDEFSQWVTRVDGAATGSFYQVSMDDVIEVPGSSRVSEEMAYALVDSWLRGEDLTEKDVISDDIHSP